jgi:hypothetical protein
MGQVMSWIVDEPNEKVSYDDFGGCLSINAGVKHREDCENRGPSCRQCSDYTFCYAKELDLEHRSHFRSIIRG